MQERRTIEPGAIGPDTRNSFEVGTNALDCGCACDRQPHQTQMSMKQLKNTWRKYKTNAQTTNSEKRVGRPRQNWLYNTMERLWDETLEEIHRTRTNPLEIWNDIDEIPPRHKIELRI